MRSASIWPFSCMGAFPSWTRSCRGWSRSADGWQKADGSFRARELLLGWDNVPMHRWAQSQIFRSLCFLLSSKTSRERPQLFSLSGQELTILCVAFADSIISEISAGASPGHRAMTRASSIGARMTRVTTSTGRSDSVSAGFRSSILRAVISPCRIGKNLFG